MVVNSYVEDVKDVLTTDGNGNVALRAVRNNLSKRISEGSGGTHVYIGEAPPGANTNDAVWRVARQDKSTGTTLYAENGEFKAVWDNRESLSYS